MKNLILVGSVFNAYNARIGILGKLEVEEI